MAPPFVNVPSRQQTELFLGPLEGGLDEQGFNQSQMWEVDGYAAINIFGISEQAFDIVIEAAATCDGEPVEVQTIASSATGGSQVVNSRITAFAYPFARFRVEGVQGQDVQVSIRGLPVT